MAQKGNLDFFGQLRKYLSNTKIQIRSNINLPNSKYFKSKGA